nr:retrotransposon protein, putative, Ty1-copia subclass [Tanacetum cinerariifolium]
MTTLSTNNSVFRGFFEKQKLTEPNFIDWYRQLKIMLSIEDKLNYLEQPIPPVSVAPAEQELLQTMRDFHSYRKKGSQLGKTVNELHAMLKLHEQTLSKSNAPSLNAIQAGKVQKGNKFKKSHSQKGAMGQNQWKGKFVPKPKIPLPPKRENPAKDSICREAGGSGIFIIELNNILNRSRIYDTGCGTHICNTTQGLKASRKQKPRAFSLYVDNGQREAVEAIGAFYLCLPSGLEISLSNCHYAPSITRGVISVSRLYEDGFVNHFVDNTIQVSRNNVVYFCAIPRDGIFKIDLSNSLTNESSVYVVSNKRAKLDLDSALLWHCRLGHISKKRIEKLQHDGLLNSSDLTAFEKCVSCMSGKMIKSRQGASYFVTFTDDFSRYGYVYLLKHKHEVFETFKVFQKEVENQLEKTIKSLRSDRGGEYMSQEFLDHLKDHGIIAHRTPPYTPQHNGISKRRNKTLLDMVRSMMSQTTLPKSFWDYALETAARILNMVPTKKVEKTPYENDEFLENIQEEDTHPSLDTSLNHEEEDLEIDESQSDIVLVRRSTQTRHAPDHMCLYIDDEEHELGDLREPANYKAALLDSECNTPKMGRSEI